MLRTRSCLRQPVLPTRSVNEKLSGVSSSVPSSVPSVTLLPRHVLTGHRSDSSCRARSTRTLSSPVVVSVERLGCFLKEEVRAIGRELGLPEPIVARQPFPGPGLGIRIVGEITRERLDLLREADAIVRHELTAAGLDSTIWQCPVVLLADVRSVGVQGDGRSYGHPIVLRPVSSED